MVDKPRLSDRLLQRCILAADCSEVSVPSMASEDPAPVTLVKSAAVSELWFRARSASHGGCADQGSGAAWNCGVVGAAVAKGDRACAWLCWACDSAGDSLQQLGWDDRKTRKMQYDACASWWTQVMSVLKLLVGSPYTSLLVIVCNWLTARQAGCRQGSIHSPL